MPAHHVRRLGAPVTHLADWRRPAAKNPQTAWIVIGAYLQQLRQQRGLKIDDVKDVIHASASKISRLENGEHAMADRDVSDLLTFYGVDDQKKAEVAELLEAAKRDPWWRPFTDVTPDWLQRLIGLEAAAEAIHLYETLYVPGLLQTRDYARAVVAAGTPTPSEDQISKRVQVRMRRQELLTDGCPPRLLALLDQSVLLRHYGGPQVMLDQLRHLADLAMREAIDIRIMPLQNAKARVASHSAVTRLMFPQGVYLRDMIYLEEINGARYLSRTTDVESHSTALSELCLAAASRKESMRLLEQAIDGLQGTAG
ncbi:helix-turn-helix transcriptional regulator [Streptomyces sp. NPDC047117]|uniref:helix-turn-helix domain-containing protein n=1 Tax=Streptomyces sp. NPDC047117 TaxID=3155379 RepID=UPI0033E44F44